MDKLEKAFNVKLAEEEIAELPAKKIEQVLNDPEKSADIIHLVYVNDSTPGIIRISKGKTFQYELNGKEINDGQHLLRIKKLAIPPAWENVWICKLDNGHLQATGLDVKKRKQYRYHPRWNVLRNQTKFYRMYEFGKVLPSIRAQLKKDLSLPGLPLEKVLAAVVSLMERTTIRVGNSMYEKLYGSFGITTLKNKHVDVSGNTIKFKFRGKKGIDHAINLKSKRLAKIVRQCKDIPGKDLFEYYDDEGIVHSIDSGMVNEYVKKISGGDYSSKDFRTWAGTVNALLAFREVGEAENDSETKRKINEALDLVSKHLGNTRNVCRKYYVHPFIISLYEKRDLKKYIDKLETEASEQEGNLLPEELALIKILEANH